MVSFWVRYLVLCLLLGAAPEYSQAADGDPVTPTRPKIGSEVVNFQEAATNTAKTGIYFIAILLLGFGLWRKFQERKTGTQKQLISIVSKLPVGPRAGLMVAEVEGERFLLAQTPDHISLISKLNEDNFKSILTDEFNVADSEHAERQDG
jgi:flagellar biogenesis protein FliO